MKILVTGAAGFIGSNLCEYLLQKGHQVIGLDNFNDYYSPKIKKYNVKEFDHDPNFTLYEMDLLDTRALGDMFTYEKPQAVVHLAAWAGVTRSIKEPVPYVRNNVEATVNLAEASVKHNVQSFIFASTSSIYGNNSTPFVEEMKTDEPLSPYPATKKACEVLLNTYNRNKGLNVSILRIFNPLGPRLRPDLATTLLVRSCLYDNVTFQQYQDSNATARDYTYINHIFEAIETILAKPFGFEIFNMGNSHPETLGNLIAAVQKVTGVSPKIQVMPTRQGEMTITYADIEKAKRLLNYNPSTTLEQSVKIYYDWFTKQEDWYKKGEY